MQRPGSVLVVDDQVDIVELVVDFLRDEGYRVSGVTDGATALSVIESQRPVLLLLDMFMPHMNGVELWDYIRRQDLADIAVVLMTASPTMAEGLLPQEPADYLAKPFDLDQLLACVARYVRREDASPTSPPALPFSA
jgi:CheY-like chemotaxis protein